jgi:tRNA G10  N-methylase Trm11
VIVTDPPWGEYQPLPVPSLDFYRKMLGESKRVLKPDGRMVVLIGRDREKNFEDASISANFLVKEKLSILVAGKKATVFLLGLGI